MSGGATDTHRDRDRTVRTALAVAVVAWVVGLAVVLAGLLPRPADRTASSPVAGISTRIDPALAVAEVAFVAWAEDEGWWTSAVAAAGVAHDDRGAVVRLRARLHDRRTASPARVGTWEVVVHDDDGQLTALTPRPADD